MVYVFGEFELDLQRYELRQDGALCPLEPQGFNVLAFLVANRDRVVSKQELLDELWPEQIVNEATLTQRLMAARKALGDSGRRQQYIKTVHGRGYRFVADVQSVESTDISVSESFVPLESSKAQTCPVCRHQNGLDAKFCNACGSTLVTSCSSCGATTHPSSRFCSECGIALSSRRDAWESWTTDVHQDVSIPSPTDAERRQLTVMFCDLVDSTRLASQLDPEDWRDMMQSYRATCADVIQAYDGYIAQYSGDALLVYFGWPQAHEDDAQRAVRSGLGMLKKLSVLNESLAREYGLMLSVRIGLHTGLVVVGTVDGGHRPQPLAMGNTPHIASRIQREGIPDSVALSEATAQLVQGYFNWDDLGEHRFEGVPQPLQIYRIISDRGMPNRLVATGPHELTPLVGRASEMDILRSRWGQVKESRGHVVLVSGEAGVGKSRLVQELKSYLEEEELPTIVECWTSSYHQHSALYPIREWLLRLFRLQPNDEPVRVAEKLERILIQHRIPVDESVSLLGILLSCPLPEDRCPPLTLSSQQRRQKTLALVLELLVKPSIANPLLLIFEDLHWADPTTLELLDQLVDQSPAWPILVVLTCRLNFQPPWGLRTHLTPVALNRLNRSEIAIMVERLTGDKRLPAQVVGDLMEKTDGVPLFIEEMTKAVIESGILHERDGQYELIETSTALAVPPTLQGALVARLDHLGPAKRLAQLGAVFGRQFSYTWLQAVSTQHEAELLEKLGQLIKAELIHAKGMPPQAIYTFKHALIQDTAYQTLLKRTRQQYHRQIAEAFVDQFPDIEAAQPEIIAHHFTESERFEQAIGYWQQAGHLAHQRSANDEALGHLSKGFEVLRHLPSSNQRLRYELDLQLLKSLVWRQFKGQAAPETEAPYHRAIELSKQLQDAPALFAALLGLQKVYGGRSAFQNVLALNEELLKVAEETQDVAMIMEAHRSMGTSESCFGIDLVTSRQHLEQGFALYDLEQHGPLGFRYGSDAGALCLSRLSWALWLQGYPEQAMTRGRETIRLKDAIPHPWSRVTVQLYDAMLDTFLQNAGAVYEKAKIGMAMAIEQGLPQKCAEAQVLQGWAVAMQGEVEAGISRINDGLRGLQATNTALYRAWYLRLLAHAFQQRDQIERSLSLMSEALDLADTGEVWCAAEMHRFTGELLLSQKTPDETQAEAYFHNALERARNQQAKSWELRAAMSLARLWKRQGRHVEARELLAPVYSWFTEGFDTVDLKDAQILLAKLASRA